MPNVVDELQHIQNITEVTDERLRKGLSEHFTQRIKLVCYTLLQKLGKHHDDVYAGNFFISRKLVIS